MTTIEGWTSPVRLWRTSCCSCGLAAIGGGVEDVEAGG